MLVKDIVRLKAMSTLELIGEQERLLDELQVGRVAVTDAEKRRIIIRSIAIMQRAVDRRAADERSKAGPPPLDSGGRDPAPVVEELQARTADGRFA